MSRQGPEREHSLILHLALFGALALIAAMITPNELRLAAILGVVIAGVIALVIDLNRH